MLSMFMPPGKGSDILPTIANITRSHKNTSKSIAKFHIKTTAINEYSTENYAYQQMRVTNRCRKYMDCATNHWPSAMQATLLHQERWINLNNTSQQWNNLILCASCNQGKLEYQCRNVTILLYCLLILWRHRVTILYFHTVMSFYYYTVLSYFNVTFCYMP